MEGRGEHERPLGLRPRGRLVGVEPLIYLQEQPELGETLRKADTSDQVRKHLR